MNPAMYIFLNRGLNMSTGKAAAQAAHAAVEAYVLSKERNDMAGAGLFTAWRSGGHYTKLVMEARDETHLLVIQKYIEARGFRTALIIDEGRTEIPAHTATALGVQIVDKDAPHTAATFESFALYRNSPPARKSTLNDYVMPRTGRYVLR